MAVEIGNEPDLYKPPWRIDQYREAFNTFAAAIRARVPQVALVGPASSWGSWLPPFVASHGSQPALATYHYYPLYHDSKQASDAPTFPGVEHLLSPDMLGQTGRDVRKYVRAAQQAGLPVRIDETNSVSGGGAPDVSDAFAAALWMAQYLFSVAQQGAAGVNVHGGLSGGAGPYYTPLRSQADATSTSPRYIAQPSFYGMLLFRYGAVGQFVTTTLTGTVTLTSYAARANDGTLRVTLINADTAQNQLVDVQFGAVYKQSSVRRLKAPSLTAKSDITLGETKVAADGRWDAKSADTQYLNSTNMQVQVPAASAVVVTLTP